MEKLYLYLKFNCDRNTACVIKIMTKNRNNKFCKLKLILRQIKISIFHAFFQFNMRLEKLCTKEKFLYLYFKEVDRR